MHNEITEPLNLHIPFEPYCHVSAQSDTLSVFFVDSADYSEDVCEHITIMRDLETGEIAGCRVHGISKITGDGQ